MQIKTRVGALLTFLFVAINGISQSVGLPPNDVAGKCYAQTGLPNESKEMEIEVQDSVEFIYLRYIGNDSKVRLRKVKVVSEESSLEWKQVPMDRPCLSSKSKDCLTWAMVETDPVYKSIRVLKNAKDVPEEDYVLENYVKFVKVVKWTTPNLAWEETLCDKDITPEFCKALNSELNYLGYTSVDINWDSIEEETRRAILDFQKKSGLTTTGNLSISTIELLGIEY